MNSIISAVSNHTGIEVDNILSRSKMKSDVFARHVCMYLMTRYYPRMSQHEIAIKFGVKQAAISKAVVSIDFEIDHYTGVRNQIDNILSEIQF